MNISDVFAGKLNFYNQRGRCSGFLYTAAYFVENFNFYYDTTTTYQRMFRGKFSVCHLLFKWKFISFCPKKI